MSNAFLVPRLRQQGGVGLETHVCVSRYTTKENGIKTHSLFKLRIQPALARFPTWPESGLNFGHRPVDNNDNCFEGFTISNNKRVSLLCNIHALAGNVERRSPVTDWKWWQGSNVINKLHKSMGNIKANTKHSG